MCVYVCVCKILRLRKSMCVKRSLQVAVEAAEAKVVKEFGADSKAAENVSPYLALT